MDLEADYNVHLTLPSMDSNEGEGAAVSSFSSSSPPAPLELDEEATLFYGLIYLGAAAINAPRSVVELQKNISVLNNEIDSRIFVILSIPTNFVGTVRIYDQEAQSEIRAYLVQTILFCVRGRPEGPDGCCFAFTVSHGDTPESVTFLSHVFKAETVEVASKVLSCFGACFQSRQQASLSDHLTESFSFGGDQTISFEMSADIKEDDGKGSYTSVPKDRANVIKLRKGLEKMVHMTLKQTKGPLLKMERCFGVLLCAGWRQKDSDMNLLDLLDMNRTVESTVDASSGQLALPTYIVSALWNPSEPVFDLLNTETSQGIDRYLTIAVDMVLASVAEPVRFCIDLRAKIYPQNERFWHFSKRSITERYFLKIEPNTDASKSGNQQGGGSAAAAKFRLVKCERQSDIDNDMERQSDDDNENLSDEEIVLSGMGTVSKEVNDEALMLAWKNVMTAWKAENYLQRPRGLPALVRKRGIPEALRGEVWQLLVGAHDVEELLDKYRRLVVQECQDYDAAIIRDMNRTFPANNFFRPAESTSTQSQSQPTQAEESMAGNEPSEPVENDDNGKNLNGEAGNGAGNGAGANKSPSINGSSGQESLVRVCRAYALYDREIGYCQGISFLAAALLLHMPEEQAFCVLFKMMSSFGLRELYLAGFDKLYLSLYQLDAYMRRQLPDLADHFRQLGVESHMFASQWFLTLFIAKFPLQLVFHILDVFFLDGFPTLFAVAISLLTLSRTDLLKLDFEGVLKYFRINMPKRFRNDQACSQLMNLVSSKQPSEKQLAKWEAEWRQSRTDTLSKVDASEMLRIENRSLMERLTRQETENDSLAQELITTRLNLRSELEKSLETSETLKVELDSVKMLLKESLEDKWRLESDLFNLKEICRSETERLEKEAARNFVIIGEYKEINARLSDRFEKVQTLREQELAEISEAVSLCQQCAGAVSKVLASKPEAAAATADVLSVPSGDQVISQAKSQRARSNTHTEGVSLSGQSSDNDAIIHQLEVELASTKLALVEAQCEIQELRHDQARQALGPDNAQDLVASGAPRGSRGIGFFQKTISLVKDVTGQVASQASVAATAIATPPPINPSSSPQPAAMSASKAT